MNFMNAIVSPNQIFQKIAGVIVINMFYFISLKIKIIDRKGEKLGSKNKLI